MSTKDTTHIRRNKGKPGIIRPSMNNQLTVKKVNFLLSNSNKQAFIILLGSHFEKKGMRVIHAEGDADLLIVKTALQMAKQDSTVLIGEDTDLLILALFHFKDEKELFFTCEPKEKNTKSDVWSVDRAKQALVICATDYSLCMH